MMLTLPDLSLSGIFRESADKDNRYEIKIIAEEYQRLKNGLRFVIEIENKTAESIQLKVPRQNPFAYMVFGEEHNDWGGMGAESGTYANLRTIILGENSKVQFDPIVIKKYSTNGKKYKLKPGSHMIIGELVFIDDSGDNRRITRRRIGPITVYLK
jgi:hypothetical protein